MEMANRFVPLPRAGWYDICNSTTRNNWLMADLEHDIKLLIIETLKLEDVQADDIKSDELLFGGDLGLDSIDALELGVALRRRYALQIETINDEVRAHFATIRALARFIASQTGGAHDHVA